MRALRTVLYAVFFLLPHQANAGGAPSPVPLEEQERQDARSDSSQAIGERCIRAFGDTAFCDCIMWKGPRGITFMDYVLMASRTKDELKYDQLAADERKLVDSARAVRDECVRGKRKSSDRLGPEGQAR